MKENTESNQEPPRVFKGVWIPAWLWLAEDLTPMEKFLLAEIDSLDDGDSHCTASNAYLAKMLMTSKGSIKVTIANLKQRGIVSVLLRNDDTRSLWISEKWLTGINHRLTGVNHRLTGINHRLTGVNQSVGLRTEVNCQENNNLRENSSQGDTSNILERVQSPIVPFDKGTLKTKKKDILASDKAIAIGKKFWGTYPGSQPVGAVRIRRHLAELDALLASGVTEAQIFRAAQILRTDDFRRGWVADLEAMAARWPQISIILRTSESASLPVPKIDPDFYNGVKTPAEQWQDFDEYAAEAQANGKTVDHALEPKCPRP